VTSEAVRATRSKVQIHAVGHHIDKVGFLQRKVRTSLTIRPANFIAEEMAIQELARGSGIQILNQEKKIEICNH
jgi:hypothetical protein